MKRPRGVQIGGMVLVLAFLAGCLPIPVLPFGDRKGSRQNIADNVLDFITIGKTTRAEILLTLGEPDRKKNNDERFLYFRESEEGGIAFMVGGGGTGGVIGTPITFRILTVSFDGNGVVSDANAEKFVRRDWGGEHPISDESWPVTCPFPPYQSRDRNTGCKTD